MKLAKGRKGRPPTGGRKPTHIVRIDEESYQEARAQADRHYRSVKRHIEKLIADEAERGVKE